MPRLAINCDAASDVLGTGWFAADAAQTRPGKTVAVVGDGAVGLMAILAAHSVIEAVGTQESFMQAVGATRGGGYLGYVGVNFDVQVPGIELFFDLTLPLDKAAEGYQAMHERRATKVLLTL